MIEEDRWDADEIKNMRGIPQQPNPQRVGLHIPTRMPMIASPSGVAHGDAAGERRRWRILAPTLLMVTRVLGEDLRQTG